MLPLIKSDRSTNSDYVNYHKKNPLDTFIDLSPPKNIEQIYKTSKIKLVEVQSMLDKLDIKYNFKNAVLYSNPFSFNNFYKRYAAHLNRLRVISGIDAINSSEKIKHLIIIIDNNLKQVRIKQTHRKNWKSMVESEKTANFLSRCQFSLLREITLHNHSQNGNEGETEKVQKSNNEIYDLELYYKHPDQNIASLIKEINTLSLSVSEETEQDLEVFGDLYDKSLDAKDNYAKLIDELEKIEIAYEKYLKSFFNQNQVSQFLLRFYDMKRDNFERDTDFSGNEQDRVDGDDYENKLYNILDTAIKYDAQRNYFMHKIKSILKRLKKIIKLFMDEEIEYDDEEDLDQLEGAKHLDAEEKTLRLEYKRKMHKNNNTGGMSLREFSEEVQKLANRYDCTDLQLVLFIPEMSLELNKCVLLLTEWLDFDKSYTQYILNDLKQIDKQKRALLSSRQLGERLFNQITYRIQFLLTALDSKQKELGAIVIYSTCKSDENDAAAEAQEQEEVFNYHFYSSLDCKSMLERTEQDVKKYELNLKQMCRLATTLKKKKEERHIQFETLRRRLNNLSDILFTFYHKKKVKQSDLDLYEFAFIQLKEILIYKQCSDNLNKIFYEIELPPVKISTSNHSQYSWSTLPTGTSNLTENKFTMPFYVISNMIDADWIKFYYELPFYPKRGEEIIKKDIDQILFKYDRGNSNKERALCTLEKWARLHVRAKVDDLKLTLKKISRPDILEILNVKLNEKILLTQKQLDPIEIKNKKKLLDMRKKNSLEYMRDNELDEVELRTREAEILHQKLIRFFDKLNKGKKVAGDSDNVVLMFAKKNNNDNYGNNLFFSK